MARSLKKGPFVDHHLLTKIEKAGGSVALLAPKNVENTEA